MLTIEKDIVAKLLQEIAYVYKLPAQYREAKSRNLETTKQNVAERNIYAHVQLEKKKKRKRNGGGHNSRGKGRGAHITPRTVYLILIERLQTHTITSPVCHRENANIQHIGSHFLLIFNFKKHF